MITVLGDHIGHILSFVILLNLKHLTQKNDWDQPRMYPCSIKTWEVLGNPSPMPERCPETRDLTMLGGSTPKSTTLK